MELFVVNLRTDTGQTDRQTHRVQYVMCLLEGRPHKIISIAGRTHEKYTYIRKKLRMEKVKNKLNK